MEMTVKDFFQILLKKWYIIVACAIVCCVGVFGATKILIPNEYTAKASFLVWYKSGSTTGSGANSDYTYSKNLAMKCVQIVSTNKFYNELHDELLSEDGIGYDASVLSSKITFTIDEETSFFHAKITTSNKDDSIKIANRILAIIPAYIEQIDKTFDKDFAGISNDVDNAIIVSVGPSYTLFALLGAFVGFVGSIVTVLLINKFDIRIKNEGDITSNYEIPILGVIPRFEDKQEEQPANKEDKNQTGGVK